MKVIKRLLPLLTAAATLFSLTACGNQDSTGTDGTNSDGESAYHYEQSDIELPPELTDINTSTYSDGKLYLSGFEETGNSAIYSVDTETGEYDKISYDGGSSLIYALYPDGEGGVYFAETTSPGAGGPANGNSMSIEKNGVSEPNEASEAGGEPDVVSEAGEGSDTNEEAETSEGMETSPASFSGSFPESKLCHLNSDGTITAEVELSEAMSGDHITSILTDEDGRVHVSGFFTIAVLDSSLNLINTVSADNTGISGIALSSEGDVIAALYGSDKLYTIDAEAGDLKEACTVELTGDIKLINGGDKDIYCYDNNGVWGVELSSGESESLLKWLDHDIAGSGISAVYNFGEDFIVNAGIGSGLYFNFGRSSVASENSRMDPAGQGGSGFIKLKKTEGSAAESKTVLEYATLSLNSDMQWAIIGFNKSNNEYRINVTDYSEYNTENDASAGLTKLNTEIIAGDVPDIIDLTGLSTAKLASLGLLADFNELMENDGDINRDDFLSNILTALETDGKLYHIIPSYGVSTVIGRTSDVGSDMGWTLEEYDGLMANQPEGVTAFANMTSYEYLSYMMEVSADSFIDWEAGDCSFDSENFIKILEAAGKYPQEVDETDNGYVSTEAQIADGSAILAAAELYEEGLIQMYEALLGDDITYIGYPTSDGEGGNAILPSSRLGISASSENRDGAWEFIKYVLSEDIQNSISMGYPLLSSSLNTKLSSFLSGDDVFGMLSIQTESGPIQIELAALSAEAIEKLTALIESTDTVSQTDDTLSGIVQEEAASYFNGSKTAEEAAKVIQDRVSTYMSEQS